MKKSLLLSFAFGFFLSAAAATSFTVDDVTYTVIGDKRVGISKVNTEVSEFNIPATIVNSDVTYNVNTVEDEAFKYSKAVRIILPNSIDSIKYAGIYQCANLVDLKLPDNLTYMGNYGVASNKSLTSIVVPGTLKFIPNSAFYTNYALSNITLQEGLKKIGSGVFYKCAITSVKIPNSCDTIGRTAFLMCPKLETVELPKTLQYIGPGAFNGCPLLSFITLPDALEVVEDELFLNCPKITSMNIPANVNTFGNGAFAKTGITTFTVDPANTNLQVIDNVIYSKDKRLLYVFPSKGKTTYSIEKGCVGIWGGAFWGSEISSLTIPVGMRAIDDYAFCESQLATVNFPASLVYMGEQALAGTQLTQVVLPENMPIISDGLLAWSKKLTSVTIPSGVTTILNHAFQTCTALTQIHCVGTVPPGILEFYDEEDSPFGYITRSNVTLSVPKGLIQDYKSTTWGSLFTKIEDTEAAIFVPVSSTPVEGDKVKTFDGLSLVFDEATTIVKSSPSIEVRKDALLSGTVITKDGWRALNSVASDKKTVRIFPCDYDGYTDPIVTENGKSYFVTIPAGIVKNASGALNQKIILQFTGWDGSGVEVVKSSDCFVYKTGDMLNVALGDFAGSEVSVFNLSGAKVASVKCADENVTIEGLSSGVYIVNVDGKGEKLTFKVIM